jgi:hypothetical protein
LISFVPDVSVKYSERELHFEVVVYNDLNADKKLYYQSNKINCIKIDLTNSELLTAPPEQIKYSVLEDKNNKAFVQWNEDKVIEAPSSDSSHWNELIEGVIIISTIIFFINSLFWKSTKNRKFSRR